MGRAQILAAATAQFAEAGYQASSVRSIAAAAGVDAKLVHYYFGTKEALFTAVIAEGFRARGLPDLFVEILHDTGESPGTRYLSAVLAALEDPGIGPAFLGLVRSLGTHETSRRVFLRFVTEELIARIGPQLDQAAPEVTLSLAGSQVLGLVVARYIVRVPALAEMPAAELARIMGPTLDRYILGSGSDHDPDR